MADGRQLFGKVVKLDATMHVGLDFYVVALLRLPQKERLVRAAFRIGEELAVD